MDRYKSAVDLGQRLKVARKHLGFSQDYVATTMHTNTTRLSHIENGKMTPDVFELITFSQLYNIDIKELLGISTGTKSYFLDETKLILDGVGRLDELLRKNNSSMLEKLLKSFSAEVADILEEVRLLNG